MSDLTPEFFHRALEGDLEAQGNLVKALAPVIHGHVAKMLRRWRTDLAAARDLRQEIEDVVLEVFVELTEDDGKVLRRWDPSRLPLTKFVGYVTQSRSAQLLSRRHTNPGWAPEERIYLCLIAGFDPDGAHLFELLVSCGLSRHDAARATGRSVNEVDTWFTDFAEQARRCQEKLSNGSL